MEKATAEVDRIDALMEQASVAMARTDYFECERLAVEALHHAHQEFDFDRMARIVLPLQEARRHKRQLASQVRKIRRLSDDEQLAVLLAEGAPIEPGCYLIEPMLVAADGRELREQANARNVPILVVVREPKTQVGVWPVVMVGPETVRTFVGPPTRISVSWMLAADDALGTEAVARIDPGAPPRDRVDRLMGLLGTLVGGEALHAALATACSQALHDPSHRKNSNGASPAPRPQIDPADEADDE